MVGEAEVIEQGKKLLFAAIVNEVVEIRGEATIDKTGALRSSLAAVQYGEEYFTASGYAAAAETVGFECYGVTTTDEESYEAVAYFVPRDEEETGEAPAA